MISTAGFTYPFTVGCMNSLTYSAASNARGTAISRA